jgi:hypothetical protein
MEALQDADGNVGVAGERPGPWLAWSLYGGVLALYAVAMLLWVVVHSRVPGAAPYSLWRESFLISLPFATLGFVVARQRR